MLLTYYVTVIMVQIENWTKRNFPMRNASSICNFVRFFNKNKNET